MIESKSDEQVQRDVLAELSWDARVTPNEIGVIVKYGVITLTGRVDSYYKKWAAEDAAHRVRGVKALVNDIEVKLPATAQRTDDEIAEAALHAIEADLVARGQDHSPDGFERLGHGQGRGRMELPEGRHDPAVAQAMGSQGSHKSDPGEDPTDTCADQRSDREGPGALRRARCPPNPSRRSRHQSDPHRNRAVVG